LGITYSRDLSLGEQVSLLGAGTERGLLARRLESVGLEDALEGLGRRTLAGAAATGRHSHRGGGGVSSRRGSVHFILRLRQTFRMNATIKKMEAIGVAAFLGFVIVAGWFGYLCRRDTIQRKMGMTKSPSREKLNTMVEPDDPTQVSS
jgi:hypothetical protein